MIAVQNGNPIPPQDSLAAMKSDLHYWNISTIVVPQTDHRQALVDLLTAVTGAPPTADQDVMIWRNVGP